MSRLTELLESWAALAGRASAPLPKKPAPPPKKKPGRHVYPAGMSEPEKLEFAKERDRKLKEEAEAATEAAAPRDPGGPFTRGGKVGAPRKRFKKPVQAPKEAEKSWLRKLFG